MFIFRFSIKYRLLFYFLFLIFLPTTIISATVYYKSQNIITEGVYSSAKNNLSMIEKAFRQKVEAVGDVMSLIYFAPELQAVFSSPYFMYASETVLSPQYSHRRNNLINEMASLDKILDSYSAPDATNLTLFPKLYIYNRPEYLFFNSSEKVTDLIEIQSKEWYSQIPSVGKYCIVGLDRITTDSGPLNTLMLAKRLYGLNHVQLPYAGLLTVDVAINSFNDILTNYKPTRGSTIYLLDRENKIISSSDPANVGAFLPKEIYDAGEDAKSDKVFDSFVKYTDKRSGTIISYKKMVDPKFIIVSASPSSEMYGELVSFNKVMVIVLVVCLALSFGVAMFLSDNVSYPIRKLVKSMSGVKDGNFDTALHYKRNDEFSFLISTYNKMMGQIKELIDKLYVSELNKKEAELQSLQAQINPHFLYNTLDSVNWLALKHKVPDISTMVTSLSDFFRYSLSKGQNIITLEHEKRQVESYLEIQRIRFRDKLDYAVDFPEEILGYSTIKLILQPIVENAILHGIEKRRGKGRVSISAAKCGELIEIKISDDGIGSDVEELNRMLGENSGNTKAYGIRNVNDRIKNTFGDPYGLTFHNNTPVGVTVVLKIPVVKAPENSGE